MFHKDIGIDLGTATVLIYIKGEGIVLREPSVVAVDTRTNTVIAVGEEARKMIGKTPPYIEAVRPLNDGVISNYTLTEAMIKTFIKKILKRTFGRTRIMMCVPSGVTDVEQRAVIETAREAGAKDVYVIEEPVAAAVGAGADISRPRGVMVVDIGGGTTDIAVISLGNIVVSRSIKIAGDEFTDAVIRYVRKAHNMIIGPQTAEAVKIAVGSVCEGYDLSIVARGVSMLSGLPVKKIITADELRPSFEDFVYNITERICEVLEETPPELHADLLEDGIILTGAGSLVRGLDKRIADAVGLFVRRADDIEACVAKGAGAALENIDIISDPTRTYYKRAYVRE